jgi:hypothetical protein
MFIPIAFFVLVCHWILNSVPSDTRPLSPPSFYSRTMLVGTTSLVSLFTILTRLLPDFVRKQGLYKGFLDTNGCGITTLYMEVNKAHGLEFVMESITIYLYMY